MKPFALLAMALLFVSCISTKNTIKNIDDLAPDPKIKGKAFVITEISDDPKYGTDPDYPINIFFRDTRDENLNAERYLNALAGPQGQKIFFKKIDSCCPFPTKRSEMGAGFLDIYEITWVGQLKPIHLYLNIYAKGKIQAPLGFTLAQ